MTELALLKVDEAAKRLSLSRSLLYQLLMSGEIESVKVGRARRIPASALDAYVNQLRSAGGIGER